MAVPAENPLRGELTEAILAYRSVLIALGIFSFAVNLLLLVPAIYMLQIYDRVLTSRNESTLYLLTLIMAALLLVEAALDFVRSRVLVRAGAALDIRIGPRIYDASFERYLRARGANPAQAFGDLASIRQFLTGRGLFAFLDMPWAPLYLVVIFMLNPWLGLFALVSAVILVALAFVTERSAGPQLTEAGKLATIANNDVAATLRNAEVIEAMGMLSHIRQRWLERQNRFLARQEHASDLAGSIGATSRFFRLTLQSGILGVGALLVIDRTLTPGAMIAASILLSRALAPVDLAISTWRGFVAARDALARLNMLLKACPVRGATTALPRPSGAVLAENLFVGAPGRREPILRDLKFGVPAGALVAVIGPSASGKSTLARALVGVWAPMGGALRLDGAEIHTWDKEKLGPWIGYLPQDIELFEGTIAENIARFGTLDSEKIIRAAQRAGVHELVLRLPLGYETPIGQGGMVLSGGQRQRVALARAMYDDPALLVLDEPNANLDEAGDVALVAALATLKSENRTVFVMTHRMNIVGVADAVLVLAAGQIRAFGPRDAVLKALAPKAVGQPAPQPIG